MEKRLFDYRNLIPSDWVLATKWLRPTVSPLTSAFLYGEDFLD